MLALINTKERANGCRLKRWALRLIGYDVDIEYVKTDEFGKAGVWYHGK